MRRPIAGAWRRLPRVTVAGARVLGRWDDPPDFDGDGSPDPLVAVEYTYGRTLCRAVASDHLCPSPAHDDVGNEAADGATVAGFVSLFSDDVEGARDAGAPFDPASRAEGRLLGTRRMWVSSATSPSTRATLSTFEFSEFGPGLIVRSILDVAESTQASDVIDVLDVFTGLGLDRRAGAIVHHCARLTGRPPVRSGAFAVRDAALTPLVWRAITSHPYSGCATEVTSLDATLGAQFLGGVTVRVASTTPAPPNRQVAVAVEAGVARVATRGDRRAPPWADPLALGPVRVTDMVRGCQWDRLRYDRDGHHCDVVVPRSDEPLPGCDTHESPLDPAPPRPLWVSPHAGMILDGGVPTEPIHLVFSRGGSLWETTLPLSCDRAGHRIQALPWSGGAAPAGVEVSPSGERVLLPHGDDLWLFTRARRAPFLLNPPGAALPRHDVRAAAFVDNDHVAAVFSNELIVFEVSVPASAPELPGALRVDAAEVQRAVRALSPAR